MCCCLLANNKHSLNTEKVTIQPFLAQAKPSTMVLPEITTTATSATNDDTSISNSTDKDILIRMLRDEKEMYSRKIRELERKVEDLEEDLDLAKHHSEFQLRNMQQQGRGPSLSSFKPGRVFKEDETNLVYINNSVRSIFSHVKFKPQNFHIYSETPGTFCHSIISKGIGWPSVATRRHYWESSLVPMITKKYASLVGNFTQAMREQFLGTCHK